MLGALLTQIVKQGTLTVVWPNGRCRTFGAGKPRAAIRLHGRWTPLALALYPELVFGEAYVDGRLTVEEGDIADVFHIVLASTVGIRPPLLVQMARRVRHWLRRLRQFNPAARARRNVAHHYDLSGELYDLFLDGDRQYSCAYFRSPKDSLEAAQSAKKRHIAAKLKLERPGLTVLDIG